MKKIIVDFNRPIIGYDGQPQIVNGQADLLSKIIAPVIGNNTQGDAWKYSGWAMDVYQGRTLELDKTDAEELKNYLKNVQYPAIIRQQALQVIEEAEVAVKG